MHMSREWIKPAEEILNLNFIIFSISVDLDVKTAGTSGHYL